jgi:hypothetical protein
MGGIGILKQYKNSIAVLVAAIYPEHDWLPWRFHHVPKGFWETEVNRRKYFDWIARKLGVISEATGQVDMDKWYSVQLRGTIATFSCRIVSMGINTQYRYSNAGRHQTVGKVLSVQSHQGAPIPLSSTRVASLEICTNLAILFRVKRKQDCVPPVGRSAIGSQQNGSLVPHHRQAS